jgi:hypothetical protein
MLLGDSVGCLSISTRLLFLWDARHGWFGRWKYKYLCFAGAFGGCWWLFTYILFKHVVLLGSISGVSLHHRIGMVEFDLGYFNFISLLFIWFGFQWLSLDSELFKLH